MDTLIARADAILPLSKRRGNDSSNNGQKSKAESSKNATQKRPDRTLASIARSTALPPSLRPSSPPPEGTRTHAHVGNKNLRRTLDKQSEHSARFKGLLKDAELLTAAVGAEAGLISVEGDMERTWRVGQQDIVASAGQEAARGRREWVLNAGSYRARYTRNGRHMAIVGKKGHVATFDWQTGTMHAELQLKETCRDITFLHDQSHFAVAQQKYVFIYDQNGVELHRLSSHIEPARLEFLPYHWLLASIGNPGYLKYQDTSTGQIVAEHRTKLGACDVMTQNLHNAVIHLGHHNGTVTLWTPNLPHPAVRLLAHIGGVTGVSVDPSTAGRYMATSGLDGAVKVWDCRNWRGAVREWSARGGSAILDWSAKGALAVASGGSVNVYMPPTIHTQHVGHVQPPLYLTHPIPRRPLTSVRFCPFQDILTIGHAAGLSSILVPGVGEPNFDSAEADPFEHKKVRREREVKALLDKIQPDMISLDPEFIGSFAAPSKVVTTDGVPEVPFARLPRLDRLRLQGKADETEAGDISSGENDAGDKNGKNASREERDRHKMRGKGKSMKRFLRKKRKNVIDPAAIAVRSKLEKHREDRRKAMALKNGTEVASKPSALDRFKRTS